MTQNTSTEPIRAWHFVSDTLRDGRPVPADGAKLTHSCKPVLCCSGLHASLRPWNALQYAPGDTLCLVECGGTILHEWDKLVCTERTIVVRMNAKPLLLFFARQQALSVVHLWEPPPVVLDYLMGDDSVSDAAWAAARAARDAAGDAARVAGAAVRAARDAAWDAAWVAGDAARAARDAAWDAAWAAAGESFDALVKDAFEDWL